jgi:predicted ATPase
VRVWQDWVMVGNRNSLSYKVMKIRRIKFKDHYVLGNLELDFTDDNGKTVDTVIFAGENGCGKTQILEAIYQLENSLPFYSGKKVDLDFEVELESQPNDKMFEYISGELDSISEDEGFEEYLNQETISSILSEQNDLTEKVEKLYLKDYISLHKMNGFPVKIVSDSTKSNGNIEYSALEVKEEIGVVYHVSEAVKIKKTIESLASTNINSSSSCPISVYVTSEMEKESAKIRLDPGIYSSLRLFRNLTSNVEILLAKTLEFDNSDYLNWSYGNIGEKITEEIVYPRISRFRKAFDDFFQTKKLIGNSVINHLGEVLKSESVMFEEFGQKFSIEKLSSGERQLVSLAVFLVNCSAKENEGIIFLIDEPEIGMHPKWQLKILDFYKQLFTDENGVQTSQIFVATHSPFIVHNPNRTNDKTIILKKDEDGKVYVDNNGAFYNYSIEEVAVNAFGLDFGKFVNSDKPIVFVEGTTDIDYIKKAAEHLNKTELIEKLYLEDGGGKDNLNHIWKGLINSSNRIFKSKIILLYDCDTNAKPITNQNLTQQKIPLQTRKYLQKGSENLFPDSLIKKAMAQEKKFIDIRTLTLRGEEETTKYNVNKDEKRNLCNWVCENATQDDFKAFGTVFDEIQRVLGNC